MTIVFSELRDALRERLRVVADHELRDRDPQAHLDQLKSAASRLDAAIAQLPPSAIRTCAITSIGKATSRRWPGWRARIHSSISLGRIVRLALRLYLSKRFRLSMFANFFLPSESRLPIGVRQDESCLLPASLGRHD